MKTFYEEGGMGNLRNYVRYVFGLVVALLCVNGGFSFAHEPVLTLNSTRYCVENSWKLSVNAAPNAAIRLIGTSNGSSWEIPRWADTDAKGYFSTTGTFAADAVGSHTVRVEISGSLSEILSLEVVNCAWRNTASLNTARYDHTATPLANGKVLVAGGTGLNTGSFPLESAELYDAGFEIPLLRLNSTSYCIGDPWSVSVTRAAREASVRLIGASNDASWEIARLGYDQCRWHFQRQRNNRCWN